MNPEDFQKHYPELNKIADLYGHEDLKGFAKHIGVEYDDLLSLQQRNTKIVDDIDFDDYSR